MSKAIKIKANPPAGHSTHGAAHRLWGTESVLVEVLDTEDDPPLVDIEVKDTNGKTRIEKRPHPTCIGQRSYREILANPRLNVHEGGDSVGDQSLVEVNAAKKVSAQLSAELTDERVAHAKTKDALEEAKLKIVSVTHERDSLAIRVAELEKAAAKPAEKAKAPKPAERAA